MTALVFPLYAVLLFLAFQRLRRLILDPTVFHPAVSILLAVTGSLLVDTLILSAGRWIGEGPLLAGLNLGRLWLRILLVPALLIAYAELAGRLRVRAAGTPVVAALVRALALLLIAVQAWANADRLQLDALALVDTPAGISYSPLAGLVLPGDLAAHAVGVVLGALILWRSRWPWLLVTAALVAAEMTFLPQPDLIRYGLEVALIWALIETEARAQREGFRMTRQDLSDRFDQLRRE